MPSQKQYMGKTWSIHPALHPEVLRLLKADNLTFHFHNIDDQRSCLEDYDTNITANFACKNDTCPSTGWSSKKVATTIRLYADARYNARVYHQRCRRCHWVSRPNLDASYAERVAYRLKKWSGMVMDLPPFSSQSKGPHLSDLCEGCKSGHCSEQLES